MTARGMHYDFKQKLNKIDSQQNRNLLVPEIDWKLNEAQELFVKIIAEPRVGQDVGFEVNQRTIDDIRSVVVNKTPDGGITPTAFDESSFKATLPEDYWFYIGGYATIKNEKCKTPVRAKLRQVQHDDEHELSPFDRSSYLWRISNIRFYEGGIRLFTNAEFTIDKVVLNYIKKLPFIHNAQDFELGGGSYESIDGVVLTGQQNCVLPTTVHREIVDLAVLIASGDLNLPDYQLKQNKVKITN